MLYEKNVLLLLQPKGVDFDPYCLTKSRHVDQGEWIDSNLIFYQYI